MGTKELPGAPWDESYIAKLLTSGEFDLVVANGYEYTRSARTRTGRAVLLLNGRNA